MIDQERDNFSVRRLCAALTVSVSGYYAWRARDKSQHAREDERLTVQIEQIFHEFRRVYGAPRIWEELQARGERVSIKRVARLMRQASLSAELPPKRVRTTQRDDTHQAAENVLARDFSADRPNQKWIGDISYIPTAAGWLYLAVIIDLYSRMVVGWATSSSLASPLVEAALEQAVVRRQPTDDLLHHSDRGSQYTGQPYQTQLAQAGITTISMSRKGNCHDNAVAESFFARLKSECVYRNAYRSHAEAHRDLFSYIETFYNRKRRHSSLGYLSPEDYETQHAFYLN